MAKEINYNKLLQKAFRQLLAEVLSQVAREGLPGKHHFFIAFDTTHPGVDMSPTLKQRYPKEMTIVLQDWFQDLAVMKDRFSVTLNFGNVPEPMVIPLDAVRTFADPSVEFGVRLQDADADAAPPQSEPKAPSTPRSTEGEVVSLDRFRKP